MPRTPKQQPVLLDYANGLGPDPNPALVIEGDTLSFEVVNPPPNSKLTIAIKDNGKFFSAMMPQGGKLVSKVTRGLPASTKIDYDCALIDQTTGRAILSKVGGGEIQPDPGQ